MVKVEVDFYMPMSMASLFVVKNTNDRGKAVLRVLDHLKDYEAMKCLNLVSARLTSPDDYDLQDLDNEYYLELETK